jgi:lipopolysaccharide biosynthesis glycosyltransferase
MIIDIAFSVNKFYMCGLLTVMNSVVKNTAHPESLRFNIIIPQGELFLFESKLLAAFPESLFTVRVQEYEPLPYIEEYVQAKYRPINVDKKNAIYMLFSRLFVGDVFPDIKKTIYIDTDVIVLGDIAELYNAQEFTEQLYFAAVPNFFPAIFHFTNPFKAFEELRQIKSTFNAGVLFTDFSFWTKETYQKLRYYLNWEKQFDYQLYQLNDETLLNLMFKDYIQLDRKWNRCGYGNIRLVSWLLKRDLRDTAVIHWSGGHHKPWSSKNIPYEDVWRKYAMSQKC